jgi:hypothetical protein
MGAGTRAVIQAPTGHVFLRDGARRAVWYAKYRLPTGRQVQQRLGPAWTGRGRPPTGYFTRRLAEDWLRDTLDQARRGTLAGMVQTGATFADAAAEYMRYVEEDRGAKPSTLRDYRSRLKSPGGSGTNAIVGGGVLSAHSETVAAGTKMPVRRQRQGSAKAVTSVMACLTPDM